MSHHPTNSRPAHGHDDFEIEPVEGLPAEPPKGEQILWQGRPDWWRLAVESLNVKWVAGYFILLSLWRFVSQLDLLPLGQAVGAAVPFMILGLVTCGLLTLVAVAQARATMYTVTDARVVMRIGAALTITLNIPYVQVSNAMLDLRKNGTGTIALETMGDTRLSYLVCWPHVRPWFIKEPQPALRCIPDAEKVAALLSEAAEARIAMPKIARTSPRASAVAAE
ncbi:photosynthetic complex putative assembly protein PuhB [Roseobacter weihaiensis]|uniref:photosynthetic complex putative assembly protein PuhB n=1 Tax=Roseobacter weihaiensis TaxID=2763262 RepID=UPI001D0B1925|nr:photosynthetic complex putative assembly protein PuhB [Roseobacter sp. H9]